VHGEYGNDEDQLKTSRVLSRTYAMQKSASEKPHLDVSKKPEISYRLQW
jgi:predicted DNA-binding protein (MmcQ/YjbR family)